MNTKYYCGEDFDTIQGREITALQYLHRKIYAATLQLGLLQEDDIKVKQIKCAIADWQEQISEMFIGGQPK